MARPLRLQFAGGIHHVMARGHEKRPMFFDDRDRLRFLDYLGEAVEQFGWIVTAYVLMSNHFHLLLQLTEANLSRGMQWLNGSYTTWFNRRHDRVGHLFQGRFKSPLVEEDTYFLEVLRYVVLNPVRARLVRKPEHYKWSSHRAVIGKVQSPSWLAVDDALVHFDFDHGIAQAQYKQFVNDGIGVESPIADLLDQPYIGSPQWIEKVRDQITLKPRCNEHPFMEREVARPQMATIVTTVANVIGTSEILIRNGRGGACREVAAWLGRHEGKLLNSEIAAALRLRSDAQITYLVSQCDRRLAGDRLLQQSVDRCIATLRGEVEI